MCVFKTGSLYLNVRCLKCRDSRSHTFWFCRQDHRILHERMWIQMWLQSELLAMVQNPTHASKKACVRGVLAFQHNIHPQVAPYVVPSCQSACTVVFFVFSLVVRTRSLIERVTPHVGSSRFEKSAPSVVDHHKTGEFAHRRKRLSCERRSVDRTPRREHRA